MAKGPRGVGRNERGPDAGKGPQSGSWAMRWHRKPWCKPRVTTPIFDALPIPDACGPTPPDLSPPRAWRGFRGPMFHPESASGVRAFSGVLPPPLAPSVLAASGSSCPQRWFCPAQTLPGAARGFSETGRPFSDLLSQTSFQVRGVRPGRARSTPEPGDTSTKPPVDAPDAHP